jgi:G:T-mismatch repair DNA endonuclease (very short patch repair protein)
MSRKRSRFPSPPSSFEDRIAVVLDKSGIRHERQVRVGWWCVDFRLRDGTIIEANGCYWHGHECRNGKVSPEAIRRRSRDKALATYCRKRGIRLIVIWECQAIPSSLSSLLAR